MPIMTNKPNPNDILANSQADIKNNFGYLTEALNKDHRIEFNSNSSDDVQGLHRRVSLMSVGSADPAMPSGANALLYTYAGNLFFKSIVLPGIQLTNSASGAPVSAQNGYTFLPGGLLIQWGLETNVNRSGLRLVTFPQSFSSVPFNITITQRYAGASLDQNNNMVITLNGTAPTASSFTVQTSSSASNIPERNSFYWSAIGPK